MPPFHFLKSSYSVKCILHLHTLIRLADHWSPDWLEHLNRAESCFLCNVSTERCQQPIYIVVVFYSRNCILHFHTLMTETCWLLHIYCKKSPMLSSIEMDGNIFFIFFVIFCTSSVELVHLKTWPLVLEQTGFQVKTSEFWVQTNK